MNLTEAFNKIKEFKVIIAGSREFNDYELLMLQMDYLLSKKIKAGIKIVIISGTCRGADKLGERYARERGYQVKKFPANWEMYGKSAGYIRNAQMAQCADAAAIFWDGESKGTKHMIDLAQQNNLKVRVIKYKEANKC